MLSVNYIANFLNKDQIEINNEKYVINDFEISELSNEIIEKKKHLLNNEKKNSYIDLYECFIDFFEKDLFGLNKEVNTNKNYIFTFFSCILGIGDENYYLFIEQEKIKVIKKFIHELDNDILKKNYYNEFNYNKNKYFNKEKIITTLKEAFNFKVNEHFYILIKYVVDYLGINLIIFELQNKEIVNKFKFISNKYTDTYNRYLPHYFIIREDDEFKPIMIKNKEYINYIMVEEDNYKIIKLIDTIQLSKICIQIEDKELIEIKKMKIDELRNYCIENDINIYKISEKTSKEIKKTKEELLNEINIFNNN
jgi:hypothetical protein